MLRCSLRKCYSRNIIDCPRRNQSSGTSGSSFGKVVTVGVLSGALATGVIVGFAKQNNNFRTRLEESIPYSSSVLSTLIGPLKPDPLPARVKASIANDKKEDTSPSLLNKKLSRESSKPDATSPPPKLPPVPPPAPILEGLSKSSNTNKSDKETEKSAEEKVEESIDVTSIRDWKTESSPESKTDLPAKSKTTARKEPIDIDKLPAEVQDAMVKQLKHQLSAFSDYLKDQLQLQADELTRNYYVALEERVLEEKLKYQRELASSIVKLQEVDNILATRTRLDQEEQILKQIWFLCQQLNETLKSNPSEGISGEPVKMITTEILPVLEKISKDVETTPIVKLAVQSIRNNPDVTKRGIFSEDALISRFGKVEKICRRVSLIKDEASLWQYMLSFAQSVLLIDAKEIPTNELSDQPVDATKLDTFALLSRIKHHLKERNLEMSLRYANQLKGEPRHVASDWIRDVRTHLEIRQAASLLQTYASSVSLRTFDKR